MPYRRLDGAGIREAASIKHRRDELEQHSRPVPRAVEVTMAAALRRRVLRKRLVLLQLEGGEGRLSALVARGLLCACDRLRAGLHQRRAALTPQIVKCVAERKMRRSLEDAACRQLGDAERKDLNELLPLARKL